MDLSEGDHALTEGDHNLDINSGSNSNLDTNISGSNVRASNITSGS